MGIRFVSFTGQVLDKLPGDKTVYTGADSIKCDNEEEQLNYQVEFLNSLTPSGMPPHLLKLKIGAIVSHAVTKP